MKYLLFLFLPVCFVSCDEKDQTIIVEVKYFDDKIDTIKFENHGSAERVKLNTRGCIEYSRPINDKILVAAESQSLCCNVKRFRFIE